MDEFYKYTNIFLTNKFFFACWLFENEDFYLAWILQTWIDSFEIWHAGKYEIGHDSE
jgi:hypothetical protein